MLPTSAGLNPCWRAIERRSSTTSRRSFFRRFSTMRKKEHRLAAVFGDETFGDAGILRLFHDLHHFFVAEQKRERHPVAFSQKRRQGNDRANIVIILERAV